uniref:Ovule protein n=1 Tax=Panagrellus redivivus TaxID=6233 RepID=A0A7E4ZX75_PANRE
MFHRFTRINQIPLIHYMSPWFSFSDILCHPQTTEYHSFNRCQYFRQMMQLHGQSGSKEQVSLLTECATKPSMAKPSTAKMLSLWRECLCQ